MKDESEYMKYVSDKVRRLQVNDPMLKILIMNEIADAMLWQHKHTLKTIRSPDEKPQTDYKTKHQKAD